MRVHHFPLPITEDAQVRMPRGARIMSVHPDPDMAQLRVYALVDPDETVIDSVSFHVYGTGHPVPASATLRYLGTVSTTPFVWHVFDDGELELL